MDNVCFKVVHIFLAVIITQMILLQLDPEIDLILNLLNFNHNSITILQYS